MSHWFSIIRSVFIVILIPFLMVILPPSGFCDRGSASDHAFPFHPGEKLTFEIRWQFIPAGVGTLEVLPEKTVEGVEARHFRFTVKTNAVVDKIYKVRDQVDAFTDVGMTRSVLFLKKQQEGKHKRNIKVAFDWDKGTAQYENFGKKSKPIPIEPRTFDPFSLFYAFRLQKLAENTELQAFVTDGKKFVAGKARIHAKEKVKTQAGEFDTYLIEPDLKDVSGVFKQSENSKMLIWVTADERRLPVRITSSVAVGSFIAELISIENRGR